MLYFSIQNARGGLETSVARRVADDGFILGSWSDPARIQLGSAPHWK